MESQSDFFQNWVMFKVWLLAQVGAFGKTPCVVIFRQGRLFLLFIAWPAKGGDGSGAF